MAINLILLTVELLLKIIKTQHYVQNNFQIQFRL